MSYIYFIQCQDRIKIGYSVDPEKRRNKIASDAPFPCDLLGYVSADDFPESELHEQFGHLRAHGEWFLATNELLSFIHKASSGRRVGDRFERADISAFSPLKAWRYDKKLRSAEVAAMVGVSPGQWSRIETEQSRISDALLPAIVKVTGIKASVLRPDLAAIFDEGGA